jgi:2'-5' RNA ligase
MAEEIQEAATAQGGAEGGFQRLFIAIPIPKDVIEEIKVLQERLKKGIQFTPCRPSWLDPDTLHLTLRFLGATQSSRVARIGDDLARIAERYGKFELKAREIGAFPDWRRPRVMWLGVHEKTGALMSLQADLEWLAVRHGCEPSKTEYKPHLTLARFRSLKGLDAVRGVVQTNQKFRSQPFEANQVILYRSELRPEGAVHAPITICALKNRGADPPN